MKKKLILIISILSIFLLTGCNNKKTNEELDKKFDNKVTNTLIDYSLQIYNNNQYSNYKIGDNEYYVSLKNLKELGYNTDVFIRPSNNTECDNDKTGITITIQDESFSSSYSVLCK